MRKSRVKSKVIVFFNPKGIVHHEFVPPGQTVNKDFTTKLSKDSITESPMSGQRSCRNGASTMTARRSPYSPYVALADFTWAGRARAAARFDGSSSAESFLRELERSPEFQNSSCDERSRMVVAALEGEPRRTLQSMDYLYEPYWRIKQVLDDLYPPPETPTHQEFYQLRCGPQGLQEYYLQKVRIGTQLNIDRKEMVNALTQGMPSYSRNLLLIATPSSPSEWFTLARRIYDIGGDPSRPGISSPTESPSTRQSGRQTSNPLRRLSEDVPHSQKRPEGSPPTPPTPCKHCQGPHWNNQCPQRSTLPGQLADHPRLSTPPRYFRDRRDSTTNRTLRKYERNYTITELECLAIIETVDRFKVYLAGNGDCLAHNQSTNTPAQEILSRTEHSHKQIHSRSHITQGGAGVEDGVPREQGLDSTWQEHDPRDRDILQVSHAPLKSPDVSKNRLDLS
ncbi:hypothetical protein LAZ67_4002237 [Cordylochernes scorpioides]|uniref:Reverse transcriptase RNase H-like domain-containing protein n=1 Tax=Cordylochernes scorpioides TaxID=51811 RepID=A0ABY6KCM1_9ARAC|nr:hypothetical protein LAZ67_4002237 [Cordylochernes scorpioides]